MKIYLYVWRISYDKWGTIKLFRGGHRSQNTHKTAVIVATAQQFDLL